MQDLYLVGPEQYVFLHYNNNYILYVHIITSWFDEETKLCVYMLTSINFTRANENGWKLEILEGGGGGLVSHIYGKSKDFYAFKGLTRANPI